MSRSDPRYPGPPPLRAPPDFQGDVEAGELEVELPQVEVVAVVRRADPQHMSIADELGLNGERRPVGQLQPATDIRLVLHAVDVVFSASIFAEANRLASSDSERVKLCLKTGPVADRTRFVLGGAGHCSEVHQFGTKLLD